MASLSYAARPAFEDLLQAAPALHSDLSATESLFAGASSLIQSISNGTREVPASQASDMIMQEGFKAFTAELSRAQTVWAQCKETIEEAWEAYTSANVQPGHMIWVIGKSL